MRLLALNSGGMDSPVATHRMLVKGCEMAAVIFDNQPFTDQEDVDTALETIQRLADLHDTRITTYVVPHGFVQERFLSEASEGEVGYSCLFSRRMMVRVSCRIAEVDGLQGLVTGENLAQVASQTLDNVAVIDDASDLPVFRPILGEDKNDVVAEARVIGTFDISSQGGIVCAVNPDYPETAGVIERMREIEEGFDIEELVKRSLDEMEKRNVEPSTSLAE